MAEPLIITSIVGARPQFVKLAPIAHAFDRIGGVAHKVVHTGQHYDANMSATFFDQLQIPQPDVDLAIGSGSHAEQTAAMMIALEKYFDASNPDLVLVYGDTNSTLAGATTAAKMHLPIGHIEAGLRSFDRSMPEEVNRLVADHVSDRLYAPTPVAMDNLQDESLASRAVLSGDVMRDAVNSARQLAQRDSQALSRLGLTAGAFGLVTIHRASNTTPEALAPLMRAIDGVANAHMPLVFPVHPRTRAILRSLNYEPPAGVQLVEPLPYLDLIQLLEAAQIVLTDSGGLQKEAAFVGTFCLTLRTETEWTETVDLGVNVLVGSDEEKILASVDGALAGDDPFANAQAALDEHYGRGDAAERIATDCVNWIGETLA